MNEEGKVDIEDYELGFERGYAKTKEEVLDELQKGILKEANTFRVIDGRANKCCIQSFIYAEEVYNEKLKDIAKLIKSLSNKENPK